MTADPDVPRRMAQARHDIDELYELQAAANQSLVRLAGGQRRLTERVEEVQQTLDLHSGRLGRLEEGQRAHTEALDGIHGRLDGVDGRLDGIDGRLDGVDGRLDGVDGRLDGVDGRLGGIDGRLGRVEGQLTEVLDILRAGRG